MNLNKNFPFTKLKLALISLKINFFFAWKIAVHHAVSVVSYAWGELNYNSLLSATGKQNNNLFSLRKFLFFSYLPFYYTFFIFFSFDYASWHFYVLTALLIEIFVVLGSCFLKSLHFIRFIVFTFIISIWDIKNSHSELSGWTDQIALSWLSDFTLVEVSWWDRLFTSVSVLVNVADYYFLYFFAVVVPYFCCTLVIFLPAISSFFLLAFGYLIGYKLAGRLSSILIFLSSSATCYLFFIYPIFRNFILEKFGKGLGIFVIQKEHNFSSSGSVTFFPTSDFERRLIDPLSDPLFCFMKESNQLNLKIDYGTFLDAPFFHANFNFVFDSVSIVMALVITTISFLVHLYSTSYMKSDPHQIRFFALLSLFTFFMLILVCADNLVMLYVGWEGVGLVSFLLIAFWFTRVAALKSALKAILINKIGDMFLIVAISFITYYSRGSSDISTSVYLFTQRAVDSLFFYHLTSLDVVAFFLALAAFVKSAQIFFHTWLADAMEGPTPVSALLHAATMVTAGVYLIIRFFFIFELSPFARSFIFIVGLSTIVLSSLIALTQYDIKKIIAYSTCSQLGLMFLACGLSAYNFALYHFFNHAFFKCLLFLIAGAVIHQLHNEQDIRKMGGLANKMPFTFICFLIASMSLVGFPGFSGAISKDCILHILNYYAVQAPSVAASLRIFSLNIIIYLTVAYSARLLYYVFLAPAAYRNGSFAKSYMDSGLKEKAFFIVFFFLAIASIFSGRLFKDYFFFTTEAIFINVNAEVCSFAHSIFLQNAAVDSWCLYIPFFLTLHALFTACYIIYYKLKNNHRPVYYNHNSFWLYLASFFNKKCYFDDVYNCFLVRKLIRLSFYFNYALETGLFRYLNILIWKFLKFFSKPYFIKSILSLSEHFVYTIFGVIAIIFLSGCLF